MRDRAFRGVLLIVLLSAIGAGVWFSPLRQWLDPETLVFEVRRQSSQWWAIPLYFVLYALLDVFFIPTQILSIAAVLMWGWIWGGTIELFAATLGAIPPYLIARSTLRDWIVAKLESHRRAADLLDREGFTLLLLLRVVPIIPYTPLNYVAGLTSVPLSRYIVATFIGIMPSTFIFAWFVQSILAGIMDPAQATLTALAAAIVFAALIIGTRLAAPPLRRRMSAGHTASPPVAAHRDSDSPGSAPE